MNKGVLSIVIFLGAFLVSFATSKPYIPKSGKRTPATLSQGWGDQLEWAQTYEEALYWSRSRNKPLMVLFHLDDCPHSQALKKKFANDNEIQKVLDEDFVVLNLRYETTDKHLSPDGAYVPRIIFVDPSMTVRADIAGPFSNKMYAYEEKNMKELKESMEKAKKLLKQEL